MPGIGRSLDAALIMAVRTTINVGNGAVSVDLFIFWGGAGECAPGLPPLPFLAFLDMYI